MEVPRGFTPSVEGECRYGEWVDWPYCSEKATEVRDMPPSRRQVALCAEHAATVDRIQRNVARDRAILDRLASS